MKYDFGLAAAQALSASDEKAIPCRSRSVLRTASNGRSENLSFRIKIESEVIFEKSQLPAVGMETLDPLDLHLAQPIHPIGYLNILLTIVNKILR